MKAPFKLSALFAILAVAAIGLAGCGGEGGDADEGAASAMSTPAETSDGGMSEAADVSVESPAADLRVTLDRLLGEHALLAAFAMQKGYAGDEDFEPIAAALDENTVALGDAIESVYGKKGEKAFLEMWRNHIGFFVDYTVATAKEDEQGRQAALGKLAGYKAQFASFLDEATGGELPSDAGAEALQTHVDQLTTALDQYAAGNYAMAYGTVRSAYEHMFMTGDALSGAIVQQSPAKFGEGDASEGGVDLRVTLDRLLGEHALLAMFATQKGLMGEKDFDAIAGALDQNSVELADAIGSVYGEEAGRKFLDGKLLWRDHIGFFVDYTVGLAEKDKAAQKKAVGDLGGYVEGFSAFLAQATELPQDALRQATKEHVNQLKGQIDAYSNGDYEQAYDEVRAAYAHMFMTGDTLAGGIVKQSPDEFRG